MSNLIPFCIRTVFFVLLFTAGIHGASIKNVVCQEFLFVWIGFLFAFGCGEKSDDGIKTFKHVKMNICYKCA
jgi:hypothetical protein